MQRIFSASGIGGRKRTSSSAWSPARASTTSRATSSRFAASNSRRLRTRSRPASSTTPPSFTAPKDGSPRRLKLSSRIASGEEADAIEHGVEARAQLRRGGRHRQAVLVVCDESEALHHVFERDRV